MSGKIKGIIVEIGGDTSGLQRALSKVNTATYSLSKELRGINSLLKLDPKNTELVSQKQKVLAENIEQTSEKLEELRKLQEMANQDMSKISPENYRNLQREIINTENKLKNLQVQASKWTQEGEKLEEFSKKVTKISSKLDSLGNTLTASLTLPVLGIGTAAITTGNDFEAQMSRVQAIAGATKEELELLTNQAMDLGAKTSFSATEVAEGMENLASAGFTTNEIMEAMPGLLDLAASSGADLATASEIAASAIRGFGLEVNQSSHVADVFAEAAARTNAQTEDMGEAMKYVAPVAKTVGLSIEETAAAIGIMSDAGIKGGQAGTTLRGALTRLTKPTDKMFKVMKNLNISFYDNEGKMKSLTEIISMLQETTRGLTEEQEQNALTTLFGTEALSGMVSLINRGSGDLENMTKSFESCDGSAQKMAETMLDNTKGAFESLSGSLESAGIAIQRALAPEIKDLAKWIQELVDDFNDLSDEEKQSIINKALLVASIGPAIKILGKLGTGIGTVSKGVGTFSKAVGLVGKTTTQSFKESSISTQTLAKGMTFLASPTGLVITTITALAGTLTYLALKQTEAQREAQEFAKEMANSKQQLQEYNASVDQNVNANLSQINSVSRLKEELSKLVDENGKVKEEYKGRVSFILNELNSALGTEYKLNGNIIQNYKDLQNEIDSTIEKKKAEIILKGKEEKYTNAIQKEEEAVKNLKTAHDNLGMSLEEAQKKYDELTKEKKEYEKSGDVYLDYLNTNKEIKKLDDLMNAYKDAETTVKQYTENKKSYEENYALFQEGKYNEISNIVKKTTQDWTNTSLETIRDSITKQKEALDNYKKIYETTGSEVALEQQKQAEENLTNLTNELIARTSTIGILSEGEIAAWRTLGNSSFEEYKAAISKMSPEMQIQIQSLTGIIANDETMPNSAEYKAKQMTSSFEEKLRLSGMTEEEIRKTATKLQNDRQVQNEAGYLADRAQQEVKSNDSKIWGEDMVEGIGKGIKNKGSSQWFLGVLSNLAGTIASFLHFSRPDRGPLREYEKWMPDMINGLSKSLQLSAPKLLNTASDLSKTLEKELNINNLAFAKKELNSKIINGTRTIYTTPNLNIYTQGELDIRKVADEVNEIFGSQY